MRGRLLGATVAALVVPSQVFAQTLPAAKDEDSARDVSLEGDALGSAFRTHAEEVAFDLRLRTLELSGNVRIDSAPFHLRADRLTLARTRYGVEVDGKGQLAFCPCLGTPLRVDFNHAIVAPGDLVLSSPVLRIYGVPVFYLPYFWLRSDEKLGLLPPDIAYRGGDGLFVGEGVHVPWDRGAYSVDLRGGVYVLSGFAVDAYLRTPTSTTRIRFDSLPRSSNPTPLGVAPASTTRGDGLLIDSRGAMNDGEAGIAWDADVLRGARGVASTTELNAAAKPWDRASAETALRAGPLVVSTALVGVTRRGGSLSLVDAWGPVARVRSSGALATGIAYDASVEGGVLETVEGGVLETSGSALSFARAEAGTLGATSFGPVAASLSLRGVVDVTADSDTSGTDRAGAARARFSLPLSRTFDDASAPNDPWIHLVEPFAEASILGAKGDGMLGIAPGQGTSSVVGVAGVAEAGVATSLGQWGTRKAISIQAAAGAAFGSGVASSGARPLARARAAATLTWAGATLDGAYVLGSGDASSNPDAGAGAATVARLRLGLENGARILGNLATLSGVDPILARALVDAPLEPSAGFLTQQGTTGGAAIVVPWSPLLTTSAAADADATHGEIVDVRGGIELRDRCRCITLRAMAAHRIGRNGVDVWMALDFATTK
ncbi:MAG: hypothetical protein FWD69_11545 [Polyangiaceae bacterium]|nr:hypothetical protein [Polyangiaceae bacterium]